MRNRTWRTVGEALLALLVFLAALLTFADLARTVRYHDDESTYIQQGRYFVYLFVERDLTRSSWGDNHWTHTQPMLTNYIIGGWLWANGYRDLDNLRVLPPFDRSKTEEENRARREQVDWTLLSRARAPMVLIGAAAVVVLYGLGRLLGGPIAGLAAAGLALGSPLVREYLMEARPEPPLMLLILLGLLLGLVGLRARRDGRLGLGWAAAVGVALGLAFAAKLTAVISLLTLAGWSAVVATAAARVAAPSHVTRLRRAWSAASGWLLALSVAFAVFVLSNPHLYPAPLLHAGHLFQNRTVEMLEQQATRPNLAVYDPLDRVRRVFDRSLIADTASGSRGLPLEAPLAVLGAAALLATTWRGWRRSGRVPPEGLVLATILAYFVGVSAGLGVAWERYFLPTVIFGTLLSSLGFALLVDRLVSLVVPGRRPTPDDGTPAGAERADGWPVAGHPPPDAALDVPPAPELGRSARPRFRLAWRAALTRARAALMLPTPGPLVTARSAGALALIVGLAAALRLTMIAYAPAFILIGDSSDFFNAGLELARDGSFSLPFKRAPLYPTFIAGVVAALGPNLELITLVQHLLGLVSVVLVYALGALVFGRPVGLLAALLVAINGSLLLMEHTLNAEAVFTPLLLSGLLLLLLALRSGRYPVFLLAGLALGLAALARPAAQIIVPLALGALLLRGRSWRATLAAGGLLCLAYLLCVGPWMLRNRATYGVAVISGGLGDSLVERVRRHDTGFDFHDRSAPPSDARQAAIRARVYELGETTVGVTRLRTTLQAEFQLGDAEADAALRDAALQVIRQQPDYYLRSTLALFVRVGFGVERSLDEFWQRRGNPSYIADRAMVERLTGLYQDTAVGGLVVLLFLIGAVRCLTAGRRGFALLPLVVATQLLVYVALDGPLARYRYPMQPLITLLACGGLVALARWLGEPLRDRLAGLLARRSAGLGRPVPNRRAIPHLPERVAAE